MSETNSVEIPLDVISKYNSLVQESLGGDSVYIRAKETLQDLFDNNDISSTDKASAIGNAISNMVNSVTSTSMTTALEWAKYEKELALKKLELDKQLAILGHEGDLKEAQVKQVDVQTRLAMVESRRMHGVGTFDANTGVLLSLTEEGKVWNDMQLVSQQRLNAAEENDLIKSKVNESKAAIHKIVADTYVNYGSYSYAFTSSGEGIESVTANHGTYKTLSDTQRDIAIEQGKGYTYNAWANALTGSASMVGTAMASGEFTFEPGTPAGDALNTIVKCAINLSDATTTADEATPTAYP